MSKTTQYRLRQLLTIIVSWILVGLFISLYDHLVLLTGNAAGLSGAYSFSLALGQNMISAVVGGILGGSFLVFYINVRFHNKPYAYTLAALGSSFAFVILVIILIKGMLYTDKTIFGSLNHFVQDTSRTKNILIWFVVVALTQFLLQISSKVGQHGLTNILRGRYHMPKEENRIFMFLDLNASTTIAEQLGDEKYHALLRDFFTDISNPILNNSGEVYQYVGDEVVVAWNYNEGIQHNRCVKTYFDIVDSIQANRERYVRRYGLVPEFRAAMHSGKVVAGEVGGVKREITYSGDVLNTTSRILGKGKELGAGIISSATLLRELTMGKDYIVRHIGSIKLRGKSQEVSLKEILLSR